MNALWIILFGFLVRLSIYNFTTFVGVASYGSPFFGDTELGYVMFVLFLELFFTVFHLPA